MGFEVQGRGLIAAIIGLGLAIVMGVEITQDGGLRIRAVTQDGVTIPPFDQAVQLEVEGTVGTVEKGVTGGDLIPGDTPPYPRLNGDAPPAIPLIVPPHPKIAH